MESKIIFSDGKLRASFEELRHRDKRLHKELVKALTAIKKNAFCGRSVKKKLIPKILIQRYNINNVWIYNLRRDWRLL